MSVQGSMGTLSWAFWPVGDRYQLTPKFGEKYVDTDSTVRPKDEINRLDLVGGYSSSEVSWIMELRDMTDPKDPIIPSEEPALFCTLEKTEGWIELRSLAAELLMETAEVSAENPNPVPTWTGDVKYILDPAMMKWVGYDRPVKLTIDAEFPTDAPERLRVGYGQIVLRR